MRVSIEWFYSDDADATGRRIEFFRRIEEGAFCTTASAVANLNYGTLQKWIARGKKDLDDDKQTLYAQLVKDIMHYTATMAAEVEGLLARKNPELWRTKGPGRVFGDQFSDSPGGSVDPSTGKHVKMGIDGSLTLEEPTEEPVEGIKGPEAGSHDQVLLTLLEMRKSGVSVDEFLDRMDQENMTGAELLEDQRQKEIEGGSDE